MTREEADDVGFEEQALAKRFKELLVEVRARGSAAPKGSIIDSIERTVLDGGRDLLRQIVETEVQYQADEAEKKGRVTAPSAKPCGDQRVPRNVS